MSQVFKEGDRLVLQLVQSGTSTQGINLQQLPPLLLGLLVPLMAVSYFAPGALQHFKWTIWLFLLVMFAFCSVLFFYTHHYPGEIHSIAVDRDARSLEIEWRNLLSSASQIVPFSDISALRVRHAYDEDGLPTPVAELILRSRPPIELPSAITEQQLRPLRAAIGLG